MSRTVAVIQARMGSTRLPGKILMPFAGEPLLARIIERVSWSRHLDAVAVATTTKAADDETAALCADLQVPCIRGDENDVLSRMLLVATRLNADILVRLTGDNPMVDGTLVDFVLDAFLAAEPRPDYAANFGQEPEETGFPYGLYAEVATVAALERSLSRADATDREHVTWFIRTHPEEFRLLRTKAPRPFPYRSLTVDTAEDYERVRTIFETHHAANPEFGFMNLMSPEKKTLAN